MREIVVGYDGSEEAERAVTRAADVAEAFGAHLVVVSVTRPVLATNPVLEPTIPGPLVMPGPAGAAPVPPVDTAPPSELTLEGSPSSEALAERQTPP